MDNQPPQEPQAPTPIPPQEPTPVAPQTSPQQQQPSLPPSSDKKVPSLLGTVGLSLALLGVILSFIPPILIIGVIILFVAFILSLIALFKKNTLKWPAIIGLIVSVIGGLLASILFVVALAAALADRVNEELPSTSERSSDSSDIGRPSTDEIAKKLQPLLESDGYTGYKRVPNFYPCLAQELYKSDMSNEALQLSIDGDTPDESEQASAQEIIQNSILVCDPEGKGVN